MRRPTWLPPRALPVVVALLASLLVVACGERESGNAVERIQRRGVLRVAIEPDFKPFAWVERDGELAGFDVELARALAADLGVSVEFRNVRFEAIINELTSGKADVIVSGMTITEERGRRVRFSEPYFFSVTCLLVGKRLEGVVKGVRDLDAPDRTLAVKESTTGADVAARLCPRAKLLSHKTENGAALDVAEGRAAAFLYDLSSVRAQHAEHAERTFVIEEPLSHEPYGIALPLDEPELATRVNRVLAAMRADGRLAALLQRFQPGGTLEAK